MIKLLRAAYYTHIVLQHQGAIFSSFCIEYKDIDLDRFFITLVTEISCITMITTTGYAALL